MKVVTDAKQINFLDERFYTLDDVNYYPSITHILDCYPKGSGFNQWLKDLGSNADSVRDRAADIGSKVHDAIRLMLSGVELDWQSDKYSLEEWLFILKFAEFWQRYHPTVLASETSLVSPDLGYGGTVDLICLINNEVWLIDLKTANQLHNSYELQVAAYRKLWNGLEPERQIQRSGIFWFKSAKRGEDKAGKSIQGEGWELKEYDGDWENSLLLFNAVKQIWHNENPNPKPKNKIYPVTIKLDL